MEEGVTGLVATVNADVDILGVKLESASCAIR